MSNRANYEIVESESNDAVLVIRDLGPWHRFKSVTNAAEHVVDELRQQGHLPRGRRLLYYDSLGEKDEIVVGADGRFARIAYLSPLKPRSLRDMKQ